MTLRETARNVGPFGIVVGSYGVKCSVGPRGHHTNNIGEFNGPIPISFNDTKFVQINHDTKKRKSSTLLSGSEQQNEEQMQTASKAARAKKMMTTAKTTEEEDGEDSSFQRASQTGNALAPSAMFAPSEPQAPFGNNWILNAATAAFMMIQNPQIKQDDFTEAQAQCQARHEKLHEDAMRNTYHHHDLSSSTESTPSFHSGATPPITDENCSNTAAISTDPSPDSVSSNLEVMQANLLQEAAAAMAVAQGQASNVAEEASQHDKLSQLFEAAKAQAAALQEAAEQIQQRHQQQQIEQDTSQNAANHNAAPIAAGPTIQTNTSPTNQLVQMIPVPAVSLNEKFKTKTANPRIAPRKAAVAPSLPTGTMRTMASSTTTSVLNPLAVAVAFPAATATHAATRGQQRSDAPLVTANAAATLFGLNHAASTPGSNPSTDTNSKRFLPKAAKPITASVPRDQNHATNSVDAAAESLTKLIHASKVLPQIRKHLQKQQQRHHQQGGRSCQTMSALKNVTSKNKHQSTTTTTENYPAVSTQNTPLEKRTSPHDGTSTVFAGSPVDSPTENVQSNWKDASMEGVETIVHSTRIDQRLTSTTFKGKQAMNRRDTSSPTSSSGKMKRKSNKYTGEGDAPSVKPIDGEPSDNDIICGRGRGVMNHAGNKKFHSLIEQYRALYQKSTKIEKTRISNKVLHSIHAYGGRFVFKIPDTEENQYQECDNQFSREKISHALREPLNRRHIRNIPSEKIQLNKISESVKTKKGKEKRKDVLDARKHYNQFAFNPVFLRPDVSTAQKMVIAQAMYHKIPFEEIDIDLEALNESAAAPSSNLKEPDRKDIR